MQLDELYTTIMEKKILMKFSLVSILHTLSTLQNSDILVKARYGHVTFEIC